MATIGIFDSGIGGLTVVSEIAKMFPYDNIVYIGDTARVPYGSRGKNVITDYALELTTFLLKQNVDILVVACNTISAVSLDAIKKVAKHVPVVDVISPTVRKAVDFSPSLRIGVIGTRATISSNAYSKNIHYLKPNAKIFQQSCPLFVPLVEEGLMNTKATELIAKDYLATLKKEQIDTLILGCTHYPFLKKTISKIMGKNVSLIDSTKATTEQICRILSPLERGTKKPIRIFLTDLKPVSQIESFVGTSHIVVKKARF